MKVPQVNTRELNGHQIIGELRPPKKVPILYTLIEWSPDHW